MKILLRGADDLEEKMSIFKLGKIKTLETLVKISLYLLHFPRNKTHCILKFAFLKRDTGLGDSDLEKKLLYFLAWKYRRTRHIV